MRVILLSFLSWYGAAFVVLDLETTEYFDNYSCSGMLIRIFTTWRLLADVRAHRPRTWVIEHTYMQDTTQGRSHSLKE